MNMPTTMAKKPISTDFPRCSISGFIIMPGAAASLMARVRTAPQRVAASTGRGEGASTEAAPSPSPRVSTATVTDMPGRSSASAAASPLTRTFTGRRWTI